MKFSDERNRKIVNRWQHQLNAVSITFRESHNYFWRFKGKNSEHVEQENIYCCLVDFTSFYNIKVSDEAVRANMEVICKFDKLVLEIID